MARPIAPGRVPDRRYRSRECDSLSGMADQSATGRFVCDKHRLGDAAAGGVLYEDQLVYAGHLHALTGPTAYRGYLVAEPKRHARDLGDLTDEEAAALGRLINRLARALKEVAGAEHVYSFVLGHGVPHLHVLVASRYPGTPREYWASGSTTGLRRHASTNRK
jgi:histidine triad (HIT) family protein